MSPWTHTSTEILRFFTEVQELFKQLGEADLDHWRFFVGIKSVFCRVSAFCFFFLGGEELKVVETGNVGKNRKMMKDVSRCCMGLNHVVRCFVMALN